MYCCGVTCACQTRRAGSRPVHEVVLAASTPGVPPPVQQLITAINSGDADAIAAAISALPSWVRSIVCSVVPAGADAQVDAWCGRTSPTPKPDDEGADAGGSDDASAGVPPWAWLLAAAVAVKVLS